MDTVSHDAIAADPSPRATAAVATATYARQNRDALEERWIVENLPLVRHIVHKVTSQVAAPEDIEELISAGTLGLVKAARSFDPTRDIEFRTYAYHRVRGAIIDEMRGRWFVPASVYHQIRRTQETYRRMIGLNGQPPSDEELAAELKMSIDELYRTLEEGRRQHFLYINGIGDEASALDGLTPVDRSPSPHDSAERVELLQRLTKAIQELPPRDRHVLMLYYERDLTMKEVAAVLNVTESRISQLHASALMKLSARLKDR